MQFFADFGCDSSILFKKLNVGYDERCGFILNCIFDGNVLADYIVEYKGSVSALASVFMRLHYFLIDSFLINKINNYLLLK